MARLNGRGTFYKMLRHLARWEPFLFAVAIGCSLVPLFSNPYVLSLDGPAHVYNATVIHELLFGGDTGILQVLYSFNNVPVPNWTGHCLLLLFQIFFSPETSEWLLWATIIALTSISFRYVISRAPHAHISGSYLVFFFFYNHFYILGFYNFLIAAIPFFLLTGYMVRHMGHLKYKDMWIIMLLLQTVFFSHGFMYGLSICLLAVAWAVVYGKRFFQQRKDKKEAMVSAVMLFIAAVPSLLCAIIFIEIRTEANPVYLPLEEIWGMIQRNAPLILFSNEESQFTQPMLVVLLCLILMGAYLRSKKTSLGNTSMADAVLILAALLLVLLFALPNSDGWAGYYSIRGLLLVQVMLALWTAMAGVPKWAMAGGVAVMAIFHVQHMEMAAGEIKIMQKDIASVAAAGKLVPHSSTLLTFNATQHWLYPHLGYLAAAQNTAVLLDNYEATVGYFPLQWQSDVPYIPSFGGMPAPKNMFGWEAGAGVRLPIEYILIIGDIGQHASAEGRILGKAIESGYEEIYQQEASHLYKLVDGPSNLSSF